MGPGNSAAVTGALGASGRAATGGRHLQPFFAHALAARCFVPSGALG